MSLIAHIDGITSDRDGTRSLASAKIDLIRHGLTSSRGWGLADEAHAHWTAWHSAPDDVAEYGAAELLEIRRAAFILNAYLREELSGDVASVSDSFSALDAERRADAVARLHASAAGRAAATVLGVSALHNTAWLVPQRIRDGLSATTMPRYVGARDEIPGAWVAVRPDGPGPASPAGAVPADASADPGAAESLDVGVAVVANDSGELNATVGAFGRPCVGLTPAEQDRLEELRYGPFARALAGGLCTGVVRIDGPGRHKTLVRLVPLGVSGFIGISHVLADAIEEGLDARGPDALPRFAAAARAIRRERAAQNPLLGSPRRSSRSRRTSPRHLTPPVTIDQLEYDVSMGRDGIALLLPSSIVRSCAAAVQAA